MGTIETTKRELPSNVQNLLEELANIATIKIHGVENSVPCAGGIDFINEAAEDHDDLYGAFETAYRDIILQE